MCSRGPTLWLDRLTTSTSAKRMTRQSAFYRVENRSVEGCGPAESPVGLGQARNERAPEQKEENTEMMYFKRCPKCHGDLYEDLDEYGRYISCVQCSHYLTAAEESQLNGFAFEPAFRLVASTRTEKTAA